MNIEKKIHAVWEEMNNINIKGISSASKNMFGKYQYIFTSDDGKNAISLIELPDYFRDGETLWEIYCIKGELFDDIERYSSYAKAEHASRVYLK